MAIEDDNVEDSIYHNIYISFLFIGILSPKTNQTTAQTSTLVCLMETLWYSPLRMDLLRVVTKPTLILQRTKTHTELFVTLPRRLTPCTSKLKKSSVKVLCCLLFCRSKSIYFHCLIDLVKLIYQL